MKGAFVAASALVIVAGCKSTLPPPPAVPEPYTSGAQLIEAMQNRYAGRWYRTLTFVQSTTSIASDGGQQTSIWYEAALLPGRLRIDFDPISAGNGALVRSDTQYVMQRGNVGRVIARTNELLLLGFDVYFLEPSFTSASLSRLGFDLSKIRRDVWRGRQMYVVGASDPADLRSRQFWVDRENLLFVRLIQPSTDTTRTDDIRFLEYEKIGRAWVAPLVEFYRDGKLFFKEEYRHVRIDQPLDTALFNPSTWSSARHWYQQR
ncbi:MAG: hypothetical protein ACT4O1_04570 [Gemmatimonadota bacterium]